MLGVAEFARIQIVHGEFLRIQRPVKSDELGQWVFSETSFRERKMEEVGLNQYLMVGAVLFVSGIVCMATKRNGIGVLMGVELVLNGANVNFVAFAYYTPLGLDGQIVALFVIVLAAAEAAVAMAIALNFYNNHMTIDIDRGDELHG